LGGLFAVIYGAAIAGSEWTWGTLKNAVARGESRSRYTLLSFTSIAVLISIGLAATFVIGVVAALVGAHLAATATGGLSDGVTLGRLPGQFARGCLAVIMEGAMGFTIATLARSQLAGIGAGIGLYFGETPRAGRLLASRLAGGRGAVHGARRDQRLVHGRRLTARSRLRPLASAGAARGGSARSARSDDNVDLAEVVVPEEHDVAFESAVSSVRR
jgi:hypothetical protein